MLCDVFKMDTRKSNKCNLRLRYNLKSAKSLLEELLDADSNSSTSAIDSDGDDSGRNAHRTILQQC